MKLVDGEKLKALFDEWEQRWEANSIQELDAETMVDELDNAILDCTLSPAELAEIMGGAMWVLEMLTKRLEHWKTLSEKHVPNFIRTIDDVLDEIENLESQAPSALVKEIEILPTEEEKAEADRLIREEIENREKANKWDIANQERFLNQIELKRIDELLTQSKNPPTAEEGSDEKET